MLALPRLNPARRKSRRVHGILIGKANREESLIIVEAHQAARRQIETAIAYLQAGLAEGSSVLESHFRIQASTSRKQGIIRWLITRYEEMLEASPSLKFSVRICEKNEWAGRSRLILPVNDWIRVDFPQFAEAPPATRAAVIVRHLAQQACSDTIHLLEPDSEPLPIGCDVLVRFAMAVSC